jgi:NADPH:quinone reductase-like Zn-dependent oxidoreductase
MVELVGAGVTEFAEGDEVVGFVREEILRHGTYAEKASVPASSLVPSRGMRTGQRLRAASGGTHGLSVHCSCVEAVEIWNERASPPSD